MRRINIFSVIALCLCLAGTACAPGGGYGGPPPWEMQTRSQEPAEQPPRTLAESYSADTDEAEARPDAPAESPAQASDQEPDPAPAPSLPPVKVGLLLPLSGEHEALGQSMLRAAQIALFDSGHGNFKLLPRDTKGTSQGAREAARNVLREGAQLILGPVFAESVQAVKRETGGSDINVIAFSTDWTKAGGHTFIMGFLPFDQIERVVTFAHGQGFSDIAIIAPQTSYGTAVVSAFQALSRKTGLPPPKIMRFSPRSSNLAPEIRRFTQYDERQLQAEEQGIETTDLLPFEAVLLPVGGDQALSIANLISHYDLPPDSVKRLGTGLFDDAGLANEAGLEGAWFAAPSPRLRAAFEARFQEMYDYPPPRLSTLAYDATALAAVLARRGLKAGGEPAFSRQDILNPNGFSGLDGIFRFHPNGTTERGLAILEFEGGEIVIESPAPRTFQDMVRY